MTFLYFIGIFITMLATFMSGINTVANIWKNEPGSAVGAFIAFCLNILVTYLLIVGVQNL